MHHTQQAIVNYQNTVLTAYRDVENAMLAFIQSQQESQFRNEAVTALKNQPKLQISSTLLNIGQHGQLMKNEQGIHRYKCINHITYGNIFIDAEVEMQHEDDQCCAGD